MSVWDGVLCARAGHPLTVRYLPHYHIPGCWPLAVRDPAVVGAGVCVHFCAVLHLGLHFMGNDCEDHQEDVLRAAHPVEFLRGQEDDASAVTRSVRELLSETGLVTLLPLHKPHVILVLLRVLLCNPLCMPCRRHSCAHYPSVGLAGGRRYLIPFYRRLITACALCTVYVQLLQNSVC